jgi:protein-arginine kinase activator protein McsA
MLLVMYIKKNANYQLEIICILSYTKRKNCGSNYRIFKKIQKIIICVAYNNKIITLWLTRVNSTNILDKGLMIGEIGRRMNSKVKLVEIGVCRK